MSPIITRCFHDDRACVCSLVVDLEHAGEEPEVPVEPHRSAGRAWPKSSKHLARARAIPDHFSNFGGRTNATCYSARILFGRPAEWQVLVEC